MVQSERTTNSHTACCDVCGSTDRSNIETSKKIGRQCTQCGLVVWETAKRDVIPFPVATPSDRQARVRWSRLATYLTHPSPRVLDICSSRTSFLDVAQKRGWDCFGIEQTEPASHGNHDYEVQVMQNGMLPYPTDFFDAVSAWHVLDDFQDPHLLLEECRRVLKPSGVIALECRNASSWRATLGGDRRQQFLNESGNRLFTSKSLRTLATKAGFTPLVGPGFGRLEQLSLGMASYSFIKQIPENGLRALNMFSDLQMFFRGGDASELAQRQAA